MQIRDGELMQNFVTVSWKCLCVFQVFMNQLHKCTKTSDWRETTERTGVSAEGPSVLWLFGVNKDKQSSGQISVKNQWWNFSLLSTWTPLKIHWQQDINILSTAEEDAKPNLVFLTLLLCKNLRKWEENLMVIKQMRHPKTSQHLKTQKNQSEAKVKAWN